MKRMWLKVLLLSFISCFACQADTCVVGVFGESVFLPCLYNGREDLTSLNISFEWRRGAEVVYKVLWTEGHEKRINMDVKDRISVSSLAQTGNFTMKLSDIRFSDAQNYTLHLNFVDHGDSVLICMVCLNVADGVNFSPERKFAFIWILSLVLCVLVTVLVTIALCFQKKWDRQARRDCEDDSDWEDTEMIMMDGKYLDELPNRDRCVI
ncbi:uncharacterized protein LOC118808215 [Colossoma macropomum]|uniref:uncharacterized protein LOC118808215 n=1 Tax=Colossoma macropomum TaxID=42526 RepID=UPI0018651567|nr:uncharacterized protein LOC118808215 [Colossoma macropomum]